MIPGIRYSRTLTAARNHRRLLRNGRDPQRATLSVTLRSFITRGVSGNHQAAEAVEQKPQRGDECDREHPVPGRSKQMRPATTETAPSTVGQTRPRDTLIPNAIDATPDMMRTVPRPTARTSGSPAPASSRPRRATGPRAAVLSTERVRRAAGGSRRRSQYATARCPPSAPDAPAASLGRVMVRDDLGDVGQPPASRQHVQGQQLLLTADAEGREHVAQVADVDAFAVELEGDSGRRPLAGATERIDPSNNFGDRGSWLA